MSTENPPLLSSDFLQEVDNVTQKIVHHIVEQQRYAAVGSYITVPYCGIENKEKVCRNCYLIFKLFKFNFFLN